MQPPLQDPALKKRAEALLSAMTLDQKLGQMVQAERTTCTPEQAKAYHIGAILSGAGSCPGDNYPRDWVAMSDAYWHASMTADSRHLPIPILCSVDAIHGNNNVRGATVFPHNIGLGAANDVELIKRIADITTREVLATGVEWVLAPTLAVARDIHWGRTYESFSEDPAIACHYAKAIVNELQKNLGENSVISCVKHWVGDGGTTHGIDQGDTIVDRETLEKIHIAPYHSALNAGVLTVMASYSSWNGDKCHGHKYLLTDVLKQQMAFDGFVLSDWNGVDYLSDDFYLAIARGVNAGIDMFMNPENWRLLIEHLRTHVTLGTIPLNRIEDAVRRIISVKLAYGLFEKPRPSHRPYSNHSSFGSRQHRAVAREAVRKSLVLLKNKAGLLPLEKQARILVAGKSADNKGLQSGGFTVSWQGSSGNNDIEGGCSIWEGIQLVAPNAALSKDGTGTEASPKKHDAAIVVVGEMPYAEGAGDIREGDDIVVKAGSLINGSIQFMQPYGNTLELAELHPEDLQAIRTIASQGVPVVVVLISGRPLIINRELNESTAFVAAWLPGSEGQGVSDVLFGDYDFQGKLSFSWPSDPSADQNVASLEHKPLFPRGYGLHHGHNTA